MGSYFGSKGVETLQIPGVLRAPICTRSRRFSLLNDDQVLHDRKGPWPVPGVRRIPIARLIRALLAVICHWACR
jgi:hypothetical protein